MPSSPNPEDPHRSSLPLCVDLDGTFSHGDTLWEALFFLLCRRPYLVFALPFWLFQGKAAFKARVAANIPVDEMEIAVNEEMAAFIRAQAGRRVYLVSGANRAIVESVARRQPMFAGFFASDEKINLTGARKAVRLVELFGEKGFDYAGNHRADLLVWERAREAIVVNASSSLRDEARRRFQVGAVLDRPPGRPRWREWLRCLRPHQWSKNLLVFVPLFTAHVWGNGVLAGCAVLAFLAFCGVASALYVFNDLLDLQADRQHPHKRSRPLASGAVAVPEGLVIFVLSLGAGLAFGAAAGRDFLCLLAGYAVLSGLYTFALKQVALLDVLLLGSLYTARIIGGGVVTGVPLSNWLLIFSLFLFLSLGLAKRYTELLSLRNDGRDTAARRGYRAGDLPLVFGMGIASGYISTFVFALYVSSSDVARLYARPEVFYFFVVVLLYWISRLWLIAHRGELHHDPIVFALTDRASYVILVLALAIFYFAKPVAF